MITRDDIRNLRPGDYITFKSATRSGYRKAKRKVKKIDSFGRPCVGYHGWSDFVVMPVEILEIHKESDND